MAKPYGYPTKFIATRNVREYRETIPYWVNDTDIILEIGCEWGTTSELIAPLCEDLIATDLSEECIHRARQKRPEIRFETLDVFDIRRALGFGRRFTKIYIDVSGFSGFRSLLDVIGLLQMYASLFEPEAIIIKSNSLKRFAAGCEPWSLKKAKAESAEQEGTDENG